jgi:hypothetical protein
VVGRSKTSGRPSTRTRSGPAGRRRPIAARTAGACGCAVDLHTGGRSRRSTSVPRSVTVAWPGTRATATASVPSSRASTTASRGGSAGGPVAGTGVAVGTACETSFPGRSLGEHADDDHDRREHCHLDQHRAAKPRERTCEECTVQPADAQEWHEERGLDDERATVGGRPELADGGELGQRARARSGRARSPR